jgi:hypothetical protein
MSGVTEKYYIEDDEWDLLKPVLSKPKAGAALCKFQNRYLYAFGGDRSSGGNISSDIERLDLYYEESLDKWEILYIKHKIMQTPFAYA